MADGVDIRADIESGTCPSGTDEPPGKATFNATLRCKIVAGQAAHKLEEVGCFSIVLEKIPAKLAEREL